ncbi:RluA family pseudouridine synthase [Nannocystaceae bacterium ST9]
MEEHEATLAAVVRAMYADLSWAKARDLIRSGRVKVEGELRFDPAERVTTGTKIDVDPTGPRRRAPALEHDRIVHVDHDVVVVRKPAGLLTVPWDEHDDRDTLIERTRLALRELGASGRGKTGRAGEHDRLGVVQRLDKDTTGLLVFARNRGARKALENQLRAHTVERRYVALVWGQAEATTHETWLIADRGDGLRGSWRGQAKPPKAAKRSITRVRVEERLTGATSISCQLETGRQHQIRIHMAEDGHPLIGESIYDRGYRGPRSLPQGVVAERPMLHAASLGFHHPSTDRVIRFEDPIPEDFRIVLEALRIRTGH